METFHINTHLTPALVQEIIHSGRKVALHPEAQLRVKTCREYLERKIAGDSTPIYGINTGFGALCNSIIPAQELELLQKNIVISHACGAGAEVPSDVVKAMLLLKIQNLALGHSGVRVETLYMLCELYNRDIIPVVYEMGSLGASGDLAPLAHMSLPLLGEGKVYHQGVLKSSAEALSSEGLFPIKLGAKEGLALLNGTQFMGSYGNILAAKSLALWEKSILVSALSLEAYNGQKAPFLSPIHAVRPHKGQVYAAQQMRRWIENSGIINETEGKDVQDPYSFRCIPQVMGASYDAITYVHETFNTENQSVSDNPLIFPDEDLIVSGGNFHGQPLAIALDMLAIALSEMGSISERRMYRMLAGKRGLPPFLAENAGLNSGYMILQYATASIASKNKQLCTPASADSLESSNGQEDHVSMGANAAVKCMQVFENCERIIAYELLTAARGMEYRDKEKMSPNTKSFYNQFRALIPHKPEDVFMHEDMEKALTFIQNYKI